MGGSQGLSMGYKQACWRLTSHSSLSQGASHLLIMSYFQWGQHNTYVHFFLKLCMYVIYTFACMMQFHNKERVDGEEYVT